jgi:glutathione S-transferase
MKIIETRGAPNPRRVRIFLAEKGIEIAFEHRDILAGDLKSPEFTAFNPLQRVPVLVLDDGHCLTETVAICRYFEEIQPAPALFGTGALGRATVEMWQRRVELGLFAEVAAVFRHLHPKMAANEVPQVPEWGEANKPKVMESLRFLNERLAGSRFIAGEQFSIADITALVGVDFMKPAKLERPQDLTYLDRWHADVSRRPSAAA